MADPQLQEARPAAAAATPQVSGEIREYVPVRRRVPLRELWTSREVMWIIGKRDITLKYKQSALGPLWLLIQPLGTLAAVTLAFSAVVGVDTGDVPYVLFALVGLAVWNYVQLALSASTDALIRNAVLVRRSICPRTALINAQLASNLPPFAVIFGVAVLATLFTRGFPLQALLLPVMVLWVLVFSWGIVLVVGSVSARFRDAVSAIPLIVQAGIFVSPVGYPASTADGIAAVVIALNPVSGIIETWRWCLLGTGVELHLVIIALAWTLLAAVAGWRLFTRMEVRFADFI